MKTTDKIRPSQIKGTERKYKYASVDEALEQKHKKAEGFIQKVKFTF